MTWMTCPLCSAQTLYVHADGMAQKDVMRAAEPSATWFGCMLGLEKACKQTTAAYL